MPLKVWSCQSLSLSEGLSVCLRVRFFCSLVILFNTIVKIGIDSNKLLQIVTDSDRLLQIVIDSDR